VPDVHIKFHPRDSAERLRLSRLSINFPASKLTTQKESLQTFVCSFERIRRCKLCKEEPKVSVHLTLLKNRTFRPHHDDDESTGAIHPASIVDKESLFDCCYYETRLPERSFNRTFGLRYNSRSNKISRLQERRHLSKGENPPARCLVDAIGLYTTEKMNCFCAEAPETTMKISKLHNAWDK
jgi:hypothetical protein